VEQNFSDSKIKITELLSEKRELEEQLETKEKLAFMATEHLQVLEKKKSYLITRFVSHFHPFPLTSLSPSVLYNPTLKYFFLTNSKAQNSSTFLE
jgi:hypothetical protein